MDNSLQTALKNLVENKAASEEIELLHNAFVSGQIFIDGNVHNSVVIVGSGNTVQLSSEAIERLAAVSYLSALHELPQPPADFVGRSKELKKVLANIEKKGGVAISGLIGMAGIGKTALGLVVTHSLVNKYSDAQFFIDLRGTSNNPLKPIDVMRQVVQSFYPTADLRNATEEELSGAYQSSLAEKKTIIFLDNAHDASQIMPLRPPSNSLMLVTSRLHFTIPGLHSVELDVLNKSESARLLKEICPRLTRNDFQRIAELCGNLPIALRLAGSYLYIHADWSAEEYINELTDKTKRLQALHMEGAGASVEASFEQSYQQLSEDEKQYWSMLSIFPVSFKRDALAAIWSLDEDVARKLAGKLHQYSLLQYDSATNRYRLHDLLAEFASTKLTEGDKTIALLNYLRHYQRVWNTAEDLYTKGGNELSHGLSLFDTEYIHLETAYEWAIKNKNTNQDVPSVLKEIPDFVYLARTRLHFNQQLKWFDAALEAAQMLGDRKNQNKLLGNLGVAYDSLGEWRKGIEYYEQALVIAHEIGDQQREGIWLGNIGTVYNSLGELRKGIEYLEKALKIAREISDQRREGFWLSNIGAAYGLLGDQHKGIEYYEMAREIARKIGDRQQYGSSLGNIGQAYVFLGEYNKGIQYFLDALKIAREIGDRQREGKWLESIGVANGLLGEQHKGIEYFEQALEITREIGDREIEGSSLGNIGTAYSNLGEVHKAVEYFEQALGIAREIGDKRREGVWLGSIGANYVDRSEWSKGIEYFEQALGIAREIGSRQHEGVWLGNIAEVYDKLGNQHKALEYYKQAQVIAREIGDRQHECEWLNQVGELNIKLNDTIQAKENLDRSLMISRELSFRELEANILFNFAKLSQLENNKESSLQHAQEARTIFESIKSPKLSEVNQFIESLNQ